MKTIQNWSKFNEMRAEVYQSAAKKLKKMGHESKAKRLEEHPAFLSSLKYSGEPFSFTTGDLNLSGKFIGTDPGATYDMFCDNEKEMIDIPCFFLMSDEEGNTGDFSPIWISAEIEDGEPTNIILIEPQNFEDTPWSDEIEEHSEAILFNNVKDARRFLKILKEDFSGWEDLKEHLIKLGRFEEEKTDFEEALAMYKKLVNKLNVKMFYR